MENIIFLDIDGVIVTEQYLLSLYEKQISNNITLCMDKYGHVFDPACINRILNIVNKTSAKVVISSTWRLNGIISLKRMFEYRNIDLHVFDITPCLESRIRDEEISLWLHRYKKPVNYVIIDDEDIISSSHENHFVRIENYYTGITDIEMNKCIQILNKYDLH